MIEKYSEQISNNKLQELIQIEKEIEKQIRDLLNKKKEDILNSDFSKTSLEIEDYLEKKKEEIINKERENNSEFNDLYTKRDQLFKQLDPEEQQEYYNYLTQKEEIKNKFNKNYAI